MDPAGRRRIWATTVQAELKGGIGSLWKKNREGAHSERREELGVHAAEDLTDGLARKREVAGGAGNGEEEAGSGRCRQ